MISLDDLAKDPEWQPSLNKELIEVSIPKPSDPRRNKGIKNDLSVVVGELQNGLLYALTKDGNGNTVGWPGGYDVETVPELQNGYHLINLAIKWDEFRGLLACFSTFEYKDKITVNGNPVARLEYTTLHNPGKGLTMLASLYAAQLVEGGWLDLQLSLPRTDISQRYPIAKLEYSGERNGGFYYSIDGKLTPNSPGFSNLPENIEGPLARLFYDASRGAWIDTLHTAKNLVKEFPSLRSMRIQHV